MVAASLEGELESWCHACWLVGWRVRPHRKNVLLAVNGRLGQSQVVVIVLTKDERRGGAIESWRVRRNKAGGCRCR